MRKLFSGALVAASLCPVAAHAEEKPDTVVILSDVQGAEDASKARAA